MHSARRYYRLHLTLAAAGTLVLVASGWVLLRSVDGSSVSAGGLLQACRDLVGHLSAGSVLLLALFTLTLLAAVRALRSLTRQVLASRRFVKRGRMFDEICLEGIRVRLFEDGRPHAFCAGLVRPRVYLSTGARATLNGPELRAVMAHEEHHARQRDPLRLMLAQVAGDALFFLPVMRRARERYGDLAEIAADEAAVRRTGGPGPLAAAMLRFDQHAAAGAVGIASERVDHLCGVRPRWELSASLLAGAGLSILGIASLAYAAAVATPSGGMSLAMLSMQACGIAMVAVPAVAAVWIVGTVRRAGAS
ncbi:MAG: M56 family metallopeptidase [Solirubrobacteraceae bacterium]